MEPPRAAVIVFMAPKCNICKYYTPALKALHQEFSQAGVVFQGVFPNAHTDLEQIEAFDQTFDIPFELSLDTADLAGKFSALVTPEVVVLVGERVVYQGRIDNSYVRVGKRRTRTSSSELKDVLDAIVKGRSIPQFETPAIGCIIERN